MKKVKLLFSLGIVVFLGALIAMRYIYYNPYIVESVLWTGSPFVLMTLSAIILGIASLLSRTIGDQVEIAPKDVKRGMLFLITGAISLLASCYIVLCAAGFLWSGKLFSCAIAITLVFLCLGIASEVRFFHILNNCHLRKSSSDS